MLDELETDDELFCASLSLFCKCFSETLPISARTRTTAAMMPITFFVFELIIIPPRVESGFTISQIARKSKWNLLRRSADLFTFCENTESIRGLLFGKSVSLTPDERSGALCRRNTSIGIPKKRSIHHYHFIHDLPCLEYNHDSKYPFTVNCFAAYFALISLKMNPSRSAW